jgi:uncharacterized protein YegL
MTIKELSSVSQILGEMLIQLLETDEERFRVLQTMMAASIMSKSQSKDEAIETIAALAASFLSVCQSYSEDSNTHWRGNGETVQ